VVVRRRTVWLDTPPFVLAEGYGQHRVMVVAGVVLGTTVGVLSRVWGRRWGAGLRSGEL
jgi:hypothetical protein